MEPLVVHINRVCRPTIPPMTWIIQFGILYLTYLERKHFHSVVGIYILPISKRHSQLRTRIHMALFFFFFLSKLNYNRTRKNRQE